MRDTVDKRHSHVHHRENGYPCRCIECKSKGTIHIHLRSRSEQDVTKCMAYLGKSYAVDASNQLDVDFDQFLYYNLKRPMTV